MYLFPWQILNIGCICFGFSFGFLPQVKVGANLAKIVGLLTFFFFFYNLLWFDGSADNLREKRGRGWSTQQKAAGPNRVLSAAKCSVFRTCRHLQAFWFQQHYFLHTNNSIIRSKVQVDQEIAVYCIISFKTKLELILFLVGNSLGIFSPRPSP